MGIRLIAVFLAVALAGCGARGFDRGALRQHMVEEAPPDVTSTDIQRALDLKPQLKFPFRLAVYLQPSVSYVAAAEWRPYETQSAVQSVSRREWRWEGEDKDRVLSVGEKLKSDGVISDMFIIPQARVSRNNMEGIRLAAAEHGADAVLVINGIADVDRYNNYSAFLYLTIVGLWLVPGTHADSLFVLDGAMWDVRNQYLYLSVEAEGLASKMGPSMVMKSREATDEAKTKAVEAFGEELQKRLRAVAARNQH